MWAYIKSLFVRDTSTQTLDDLKSYITSSNIETQKVLHEDIMRIHVLLERILEQIEYISKEIEILETEVVKLKNKKTAHTNISNIIKGQSSAAA
jgi:hypothetical protein